MINPQQEADGRTPFRRAPYQEYIKYMGSKSKIMDFVIGGINAIYAGGPVCDLFAGSCSLSGALGSQVSVLSNDIQAYSSILAGAYLTSWKDARSKHLGQHLVQQAFELVEAHAQELPDGLSYEGIEGLKAFNTIEERSRQLLETDLSFQWHLFTKYYSGTWWSAEQCLWIDALREVAEQEIGTPYYHVVLASLMHAMAYCSQGTGHYAQYRDAKTRSSMDDIASYRRRSISDYFVRKLNKVFLTLPNQLSQLNHEITCLDYEDRLNTLPECTVYADPPYCFVHYSRFYHALETLTLYDYPELQIKGGQVVKGRYRDQRHQSPFCIRSQVSTAFHSMFSGVVRSGSNLVLSYSDTGMISLDELTSIAETCFGVDYELCTKTMDHTHMTMGRRNDRDRSVQECLVLARRKRNAWIA